MRKGIQPALEQYLVTAGGGEGAAVVAAAAAASMDKRALLASPGFPAAAAPSAYIQILTTNTSTTSCSSSLQSGAVAAGPLLPSAPGVEQTAGMPFPSPGIFPTEGSNLGLLQCRQILYRLNYQGSPCIPLLFSIIIINFVCTVGLAGS